MNRLIIGVGMALLLASCGSPSGEADYSLLPVKSGGRFGYINPKGEYVINPQFDDATMFREGIARVKKDGKYGYILPDGSYLCNPVYVEATIFHEGVAWTVKEKGAPVAIDRSGKELFTAKNVNAVWCYSEGMAEFQARDENGDMRFGFMNNKCEVAIPNQFTDVGSFSQGLAAVSKEYSPYGYIDKKGDIRIDYQFGLAWMFDRHGYAVVKADGSEGLYGTIDKTGKYVINPQFASIRAADSRYYVVQLERNGDYGYCDRKGKLVINPQFKEAFPFYDADLAAVMAGDQFGYIDRKGKIVIQPQFDGAAPFWDDYAFVYAAGKNGIVDKKGQFVVNPQFQGVASDMVAFETSNLLGHPHYTRVLSHYLDIDRIAWEIKRVLADGKIDGMPFPPSVSEIQEKYGLQKQKVPTYEAWDAHNWFADENVLMGFLFEGFFYQEVSDGWWGTKSVLDKQAKADQVSLSFWLYEQMAGRSADLSEGLKQALGKKYGDFTFDIRADGGNKVVMKITKQ